MLKKIIDFFTGKKPAEPVVAAPYKVPDPVATTPIPLTPANEPPKCGCGRSSTGFCVGLHKLSPEAWAAKQATINPVAVVEIAAEPVEPVKKKRTYAKKPAAITASAKPRARKPKQ
jgi:hypothetical protein